MDEFDRNHDLTVTSVESLSDFVKNIQSHDETF